MIIGIPVYNDVDMLDVAGPYEMFRWANLDVELVAERPGSRGFSPTRRASELKSSTRLSRTEAAVWNARVRDPDVSGP